MSFKKYTPLTEGLAFMSGPFLTKYDVVADLDALIFVGSHGLALVTKDGRTVYNADDYDNISAMWTIRRAEEEAAKNPDHDWKIMIYEPEYADVVYQRQDVEKWFLVWKNIYIYE